MLSSPDTRYTVVYEGDPAGVKILSGELAPGRATVIMSGDLWADLKAAEAARDAALARAERLERLHQTLADAQPTIARHGDDVVLYCPDGTITDDLYAALERAAGAAAALSPAAEEA